MSVLQHSVNSSKGTRTVSPGKETTEKVKEPKVQCSIPYSSDLKTAMPGKTLAILPGW